MSLVTEQESEEVVILHVDRELAHIEAELSINIRSGDDLDITLCC